MKPGKRAIVSSKGQITIPGGLRRKLGIGPGTVVEFHEEPGRIVLTKAQVRDPVEAVTGILASTGKGTDEVLLDLRGPVDFS